MAHDDPGHRPHDPGPRPPGLAALTGLGLGIVVLVLVIVLGALVLGVLWLLDFGEALARMHPHCQLDDSCLRGYDGWNP